MRHEATTRYDRKGLGMLPQVVGTMETLGHLITHPAVRRTLRTTIEPTGWLLSVLSQGDFELSEVGRVEGEETLWLMARSGRDAIGRKLPKKVVDYADTPTTIAMREELGELNAYLNAQRIELDGKRPAGIALHRQFLLRSPDDPHTFDLHGRLYGGFWLTLPKERRRGLTINGEPIADLDYSAMFPRLAYIRAALEAPPGDLYDIPGLEGHRAAAKAGFAALLSSASEVRRLASKIKEGLPQGWTASRLTAAIAARHPALKESLGRDLALDLMFTESRILLEAIRLLRAQDVPALPMHDGIMVPASKLLAAQDAMGTASKNVVGVRLPVVEKAV